MNVWPQTYTPIIGPEQVAYMLALWYTPQALEKQMTESQHLFIICYDNDEPVAFASWNQIETGISKLHKLYVIPGHHGKGIGRFIVGHILNELRLKGIRLLRLNVNRYNHSAIAFYTKAGFSLFKDEGSGLLATAMRPRRSCCEDKGSLNWTRM